MLCFLEPKTAGSGLGRRRHEPSRRCRGAATGPRVPPRGQVKVRLYAIGRNRSRDPARGGAVIIRCASAPGSCARARVTPMNRSSSDPRCLPPSLVRSVCGCVLAGMACALGLAACQDAGGPYPSHEIKLIVQASPGGISDTVSRFMASLVEKDTGVPVVCENKPGASGALAFSYVTRRPPDGYTIGHAPVEIAMVRALGYAEIGPEDMELSVLSRRRRRRWSCRATRHGRRWMISSPPRAPSPET